MRYVRGYRYVTRLCSEERDWELVIGKFHNHCEQCPGFGVCIGDYRNAHCGHCGDHYFSGLSGFRCDCRGRQSDRDFFGGGLGGGFSSDSEDDYDRESDSESDDTDDTDAEHKEGAVFLHPAGNCWCGGLRGMTEAIAMGTIAATVQQRSGSGVLGAVEGLLRGC